MPLPCPYVAPQGAIEFVVEEEGEIFVTRTLEPGSVIGELGFFFGMKQSESARSKLNSQGAALFVLHHKVCGLYLWPCLPRIACEVLAQQVHGC